MRFIIRVATNSSFVPRPAKTVVEALAIMQREVEIMQGEGLYGTVTVTDVHGNFQTGVRIERTGTSFYPKSDYVPSLR